MRRRERADAQGGTTASPARALATSIFEEEAEHAAGVNATGDERERKGKSIESLVIESGVSL